ncbi:hypothetical protein PoB_001022200 [Plakobranchus ocellatus]|uniref:Uncharacterized protein n=1 Tax=Plakobranchus ocellatus TaxID=259542 RepID=A0AAV3YLC3_9GAST|nr:hypothetical protein PoB_001022200 [Plakobranchus ocellatus]
MRNTNEGFGFLYIASPQQGDLRLSGPPSGQGVGSGARTRDRMVPADLRADSQATVLPTPQHQSKKMCYLYIRKPNECIPTEYSYARASITVQASN